MGATTFETYAEGHDPDTAFNTARDDAAFEHGHGHYSGTIAGKDDYVIITDDVTDLDQAEALAATLLDRDDPRVGRQGGPGGRHPGPPTHPHHPRRQSPRQRDQVPSSTQPSSTTSPATPATAA